MKIAIVCDWLVTLGGAEKVLAELFHCFPEADLFAVIDHLDETTRQTLGIPKARTSFLQSVPFIKKIYRYTLPMMPMAIERLDVSQYDIVISSSHAVAKGIKTHAEQKHICYIHSPMRYVWNLKEQYLSQLTPKQQLLRPLMRYFLAKLRKWDAHNSQFVAHFIANSQYIANRVSHAYGREADVIYPPIDTDYFSLGTKKEDYYLTASRLVPYKRIDIMVNAFANSPDRQLIIIGDGPEMQKLKSMATPNVTLLGFQSQATLKHYLQTAKAFIFAAEEDFGIAPLEAQACGTPVIAYGKGGALETVRNIADIKPTGVFFDHQTSAALYQALDVFEENNEKFSSDNCRENALKFSALEFREKIKKVVLAG